MKVPLTKLSHIVVLSLSLASCKTKDQGRSDFITQRAMKDLATGMRLNHSGEEPPKQLEKMTPKELFEYMDSIDLIYYDSWLGHNEIVDAWGNPFKISTNSLHFTIKSAGRDQTHGTEDDIIERTLISP